MIVIVCVLRRIYVLFVCCRCEEGGERVFVVKRKKKSVCIIDKVRKEQKKSTMKNTIMFAVFILFTVGMTSYTVDGRHAVERSHKSLRADQENEHFRDYVAFLESDEEGDEEFPEAMTGATGMEEENVEEEREPQGDYRASKEEGESTSAVAYTASGEEHPVSSGEAKDQGIKMKEEEEARLAGADVENVSEEALSEKGTVVKGSVSVSEVPCAEWLNNEYNKISITAVLGDVLFQNGVLLEGTGGEEGSKLIVGNPEAASCPFQEDEDVSEADIKSEVEESNAAEELAQILAAKADEKETNVELVSFTAGMTFDDEGKRDCVLEKTEESVSEILGLGAKAEYTLEGDPSSESVVVEILVEVEVEGGESRADQIDQIRQLTKEPETLKAALVAQCALDNLEIQEIEMVDMDVADDSDEAATGGATGAEEPLPTVEETSAGDDVYIPSRFAELSVRMSEGDDDDTLKVPFVVIFPGNVDLSIANQALNVLTTCDDLGEQFRETLETTNSGEELSQRAFLKIEVAATVISNAEIADLAAAEEEEELVVEDEETPSGYTDVDTKLDFTGITLDDVEKVISRVGQIYEDELRREGGIPSTFRVVETYEERKNANGEWERVEDSDMPRTLAEGEAGAGAFLQLQEQKLSARVSSEEETRVVVDGHLTVREGSENLVIGYVKSVDMEEALDLPEGAHVTLEEAEAVSTLNVKSTGINDGSTGSVVGASTKATVIATCAVAAAIFFGG